MNKKIIIIILALLIIVTGAFVISNSNQSGDSSSNYGNNKTPKAKENTIAIEDFKYNPSNLTIKKGTTITWVNKDNTQHNVAFTDKSKGKVENGKLINKGETLSYTFNEVGTFDYFCEVHPYMKASIEVTN